MAQGPLQPFHRRTLRALAGFVVTFLLAGHALAAAGLCVVAAPDAPATHAAAAGCAEHPQSEPAPGVKHLCAADDPTPQARSVDVPAAQIVAAIDTSAFHWTPPVVREAGPIEAREVPPPPLYARLQRLRL